MEGGELTLQAISVTVSAVLLVALKLISPVNSKAAVRGKVL